MNNSKKLLIPAVALLTISVAAAATSTIAWFASSNLANVNVSNIIAKAEGNLDATFSSYTAYGAQTAATSAALPAEETGIAINALRDASLDLTGTVACVEKGKSIDGALANSYRTIDVTADSLDEKAKTYYFAKIDFNFKISGTLDAGKDYGIFFRSEALTSAVTIASAVRVGLKSNDAYCVWAPYYSTTSNTGSTAALKFAKSTDTTTGTGSYQYSSTGTTGGDKAFSSHTVADTAKEGDSNYLGKLNSTNNAAGLTVSTYIWFEGEDADCVSNKISETAITLPLNFVAVNITGNPAA